jgi:hypothetical protein
MDILSIIIIAILIEAIIQAVKPVFMPGAAKLSVWELVSMGIGVIIAVVGRFNLLAGMVTTDSTILLYVFYVLTGVALGRGPSFVHDLWLKLRSNYGNGLSE